MLQQIKNWFLKPYPFPTTNKQKIFISLVFGKFIFLFLLIFKPFGFHQLNEFIIYYALMYGLITAGIMLLFFFIFPFLFSKFFNPNKWVIYKMLIFVFAIVIAIGIGNWFFSNTYLTEIDTTTHTLFFHITSTILVGVFPILLYIFSIERIRNKQHKTIANSITTNNKLHPKKEQIVTQNDTIILFGDNKEETVTLGLNNLLYVSSEKNYASVFYIENNKIKETLLRISLTKLEEQFKDYNAIIRCHNSYIVNTNKVTEIQGNARSYLLKIPFQTKNDNTMLIPVSRSFPKELLFTLVG